MKQLVWFALAALLAMGFAGCVQKATPNEMYAPTPHPTMVYSSIVSTPTPTPTPTPASEERFGSYLKTYLEDGFFFALEDLDTQEEEFRNDETIYRLMLETAQNGETMDERLACVLWLASRDYEALVAKKGTSGYDSQEYSHGNLYDDIADAARVLFEEIIAQPEAFDKYRYVDTDIGHVNGIGLGGHYEVTAVVAMNGDAARAEEMLSLLSADGWPEADYQELLQPFTDFLFYNPENTITLMPKMLEKGVDAGRMYSYLLGNYFADADANIALAHEFLMNYYGQGIGLWDDQELYSLEFRLEPEDIDVGSYTPQGAQAYEKGNTALVVLHDGEFYETKLAWFAQSEERSVRVLPEYMPASLDDTDMIIVMEQSFEKTVEYTDMSGSGVVYACGYASIVDIYVYEYPSGSYIGKAGQVRSEPPGTVTISSNQGAVYADFDTEDVIDCIAEYMAS